MAYNIVRYNGTRITTVVDGTIDNTLDLKLIGKNYAGFGEAQNQNFVYLLENFAGTTEPPRPIPGQLWYDSGRRKLKFYTIVNNAGKWRTTGGAEIGPGPISNGPTGLSTGDFWYRTDTNQLYAWDEEDNQFYLIGPQAAAGAGTTQMRSRTIYDDGNPAGAHDVIEAVINDEITFVISRDAEFTLGTNDPPLPGFTKIKKGITLVNTDNTGVNTDTTVYWGTASNSIRFNGLEDTEFIKAASPTFLSTNPRAVFESGLVVGQNTDVVFSVESSIPTLAITGSQLVFTTGNGANSPLSLSGANVVPGSDNAADIGTSGLKYKTVYAYSFNGTATQSDTLAVNGSYRSASLVATPNTIAARDGSGNITSNYFNGIATSAQFADLAEKYLADDNYEVGTVLRVGGEKEVTASSWGDRAIGVVSEKPAFIMNEGLENGTLVALKGRVPVKVAGSVKKGDRLVASNNGCAMSAVPHSSDVFAIALETNDDINVKLVEAVIL